MHRFYVPQSFEGDAVDLDGDEAAHMLRVLRLSVGTRVTLFDGKGGSAVAEIRDARKRSVRLQICERLATEARSGPEITLVTAVPKSDRFRWLVEKATELGVKRIVPVRTERSVVHPGDGKREKMLSASIAACKQCGRNDLLIIEQPADWAAALPDGGRNLLLIADPGGARLNEVATHTDAGDEATLAIGPEGGLTTQEIDLARERGGKLVSLGPSILRIETAAIAMAAWIRLISAPSESSRQSVQ